MAVQGALNRPLDDNESRSKGILEQHAIARRPAQARDLGASYSLTLVKNLQLAACKVVLPQTSAFRLGSRPSTAAAGHGAAGTPSSWARDTHCRRCVFISCPVLSELRPVEHGDVYPPAVPSWR